MRLLPAPHRPNRTPDEREVHRGRGDAGGAGAAVRSLPKELFEAARIDGAGHFRSYTRIALPLITPALATTAIFTFIWTWSDFFGPLVYLRVPESWPVSVALKGYLDAQSSSDYGSMFAMSVVSLLPMFLVFVFGQRFLIKGMATTGIK